MTALRIAIIVLATLVVPGLALGQGAQVAFGGLKHDSSLPVEVTADSLQVNQADGSAVFTGNVVIGQGDMRLTAARVEVEYAAEGADAAGRISTMRASGRVTVVTGADAAEGNEALYTIDTGTIVMTGDVILTQGQNALSGQRLVVNLEDGTGVMEGRVKTIFQTGGSE